MKPSSFKYEKPQSLKELTAALAKYGEDAKILAGGQSLVPMMNFRMFATPVFLDINGLEELDYIRVDKDVLAIGALTRHDTVARSEMIAEKCPLISEAYVHVAHKTIRNRGTIGGNLSHNDPASEMPAVMQCLEASFVLQSDQASRTVSAADFFTGSLETALSPNEVLTEIRVPLQDSGEGSSFQEMSPRKGDFAVAAIAATISLEGRVCQTARLAHAGVASHAGRLNEVEAALVGNKLDEAAIAEAALLASSAIDPAVLNFHGDGEYKLDLLQSLSARAITQAVERCSQ